MDKRQVIGCGKGFAVEIIYEKLKDDKKKYIFKLKEKRKIDHNLINSLKKDDNIEII